MHMNLWTSTHTRAPTHTLTRFHPHPNNIVNKVWTISWWFSSTRMNNYNIGSLHVPQCLASCFHAHKAKTKKYHKVSALKHQKKLEQNGNKLNTGPTKCEWMKRNRASLFTRTQLYFKCAFNQPRLFQNHVRQQFFILISNQEYDRTAKDITVQYIASSVHKSIVYRCLLFVWDIWTASHYKSLYSTENVHCSSEMSLEHVKSQPLYSLLFYSNSGYMYRFLVSFLLVRSQKSLSWCS